MPRLVRRPVSWSILSLLAVLALPAAAESAPPPGLDAASMAAVDALVEMHGAAERERIERGVGQVADFWRAEDGGAEDFRAFVEAEFLPRGDLLDRTFDRFEFAMERVGGYFASLGRDLRRGVDLEIGPLLPLDRRLGAWSPGAHVADDLFANKIAFVALLNFPHTSLATKLAHGGEWTRRDWAETRLAGAFAGRVPAEVNQEIGQALSVADNYINGYNVFMHHLVDDDGRRLFPSGLRLISHWGLRDELKARYADPEGLARQRTIQQVFDRIVRQEIPRVVVDDPRYDWNPFTNQVTVAPAESVAAAELESAGLPADARRSEDTAPPAADLGRREPDTRYERWLGVFQAMRLADPYSPDNPTFVARRFNDNREIPQEEVEALFVSVLSSPLSARVGAVVAGRLGRPLEPFDVWYVGFKPRGAHSEADLDALTKARYPTADAFAEDIPRILVDLGFAADRARFVADHVVVEPSRGAGHAFGAARRDDAAHLRTRVGPDGMDYKGYNIAVHELGHNVEQVFGVTEIDHTLLQGVPNTAFTEALAFTFQNRDLELLGLAGPGEEAADLAALDTFWSTREIAGVALTDMRIWRWLYAHPEASPAEMREAVVEIARGVWNEFNASIFGSRDETLLAVYSHMVDGAMYTPDYPLGHLIAFQIERFFETSERPFGVEFERVAKLGQLTPDAWMRQAVGAPLSAAPLLAATEAALARFAGGAAAGGLEAMLADEPRVALATSIGLEAPIAVEEGLASSPDGTPIHYVTAGEGEPAVVLIHCWGCDATYWSWQLAALAAERQVVAVDLAGHGASGAEREEWTMEAFGADVAAVVEALGIERAVLVGHSMGGYVMLAAAEQMPGKVAGMVAVDTLHDVEQEYPEEAIANYVAALRRDFPNTVMAAMRQYFPPDADPAVVAAVVTDMAATEPAVGVSAFEHIVSYDAAGALDRLGLPLRAVQATMRPTAEETNRRHAPDYAATYVDGVGHWPMFEAPEAFEAALVERVEELAAGANAGP